MIQAVLIAAGVLAGCAIMTIVAGKYVFAALARLEGYDFTEQAVDKDNKAVLIRFAGFLGAMILGTMQSHIPVGPWYLDMLAYGQNMLMTFVALVVALFINDMIILRDVRHTDEVAGKANIAVALIEMGSFIATAMILAGSILADGGFWVLIGWFAIGQSVLFGLTWLYSKVFASALKAIEVDANPACGLLLAAFLISAGIMIGRIIPSDMPFGMGLLVVAGSTALWLVVVAVIELVFNYAVLPRGQMIKEIMEDRNWGVAAVGALIQVPFTISFVQHLVN